MSDFLTLKLSGNSGVPFYRQIKDQIAHAIISGQLKPGDKIPSYRELAPKLIVSMITVRSAYQELEQDGLITRRQGQGTYVNEVNDFRKHNLASRKSLRNKMQILLREAKQLGISYEEVQSWLGDEWGH